MSSPIEQLDGNAKTEENVDPEYATTLDYWQTGILDGTTSEIMIRPN